VVAATDVLAVFGTYLVATVSMVVTLHLAARYTLGDVAVTDALLAAPLPALVLVVGRQFEAIPIPVVIVVFAVVDAAAIRFVYDTDRRWTAVVTVVHYAIVVIVGTIAAGVLQN
jgi:DUF1365 family protein